MMWRKFEDFIGCWVSFNCRVRPDFPVYNKGNGAFAFAINLPFVTIIRI